MESGSSDDSHAFILLLDEELKEQINSFSAKLGLSQRRFIEWAVRSYLRFLSTRTDANMATLTPQQFLTQLVQAREK